MQRSFWLVLHACVHLSVWCCCRAGQITQSSWRAALLPMRILKIWVLLIASCSRKERLFSVRPFKTPLREVNKLTPVPLLFPFYMSKRISQSRINKKRLCLEGWERVSAHTIKYRASDLTANAHAADSVKLRSAIQAKVALSKLQIKVVWDLS